MIRFVGVACLLAPALLGTAPARAQEAEGFEALRDRGLEYLKRGRAGVALSWLARAEEAEGGGDDFRTVFGLARAAHAELVLEKAFPAARRAAELADNDRRTKQAKALLDRLEEFYAGVTLQQAPEQGGRVARGYIHLEETGGLINTDKKERFQRIRAHFKKTAVSLPITIYLPFGEYTANLAPFTIAPGETAKAVTFLDPPKGEGGVAWWWYVGGAAVVAGAATAALLLLAGADDSQGLEIEEIRGGGAP